MSTFRFVDVSVCRRFGLSTVLVCRRFGLSTFRSVDVSVCRRFGCRRFGLSTFWPVTIRRIKVFWMFRISYDPIRYKICSIYNVDITRISFVYYCVFLINSLSLESYLCLHVQWDYLLYVAKTVLWAIIREDWSLHLVRLCMKPFRTNPIWISNFWQISEGEIWSMGVNSMGQLGRKVCELLTYIFNYDTGHFNSYKAAQWTDLSLCLSVCHFFDNLLVIVS